jgi:hypothetical protein
MTAPAATGEMNEGPHRRMGGPSRVRSELASVGAGAIWFLPHSGGALHRPLGTLGDGLTWG